MDFIESLWHCFVLPGSGRGRNAIWQKRQQYLNTQQKEFHKTITGFCERKAVWQVWSDFLECSAIAISNCLDRSGEIHDKREQRYLQIIRGYKEQEQLCLCRLLGYVRDTLEENPEQDFLGDMYMALNLNSHWHGARRRPKGLGFAVAI